MAIVAFEAGSARVGGLAHIGLGLKLATERMHAERGVLLVTAARGGSEPRSAGSGRRRATPSSSTMPNVARPPKRWWRDRGRGGRAIAVKADVGVEADILALFETADRFGPLAVLVNNAGIVDRPAKLVDMTAERMERMFRVNAIGAMLCAREAARRLSTARGGSGGAIVNLSSAAAKLGAPDLFVDYAASKARSTR